MPEHLNTEPGFSLIPDAVDAPTVAQLLGALERVPVEAWQRRDVAPCNREEASPSNGGRGAILVRG